MISPIHEQGVAMNTAGAPQSAHIPKATQPKESYVLTSKAQLRLLVLALLSLAACGGAAPTISSRGNGPQAAAPPPQVLRCSAGEAPLATREYHGDYEWRCGEPACAQDTEAVWEPVPGSEDPRGIRNTRSECLPRCDSGDPRAMDGTCPGLYSVDSRVEQNSLIVTASAGQRRVGGVRVRLTDADVTAVTNSNGNARFDLSSEPLRSLVQEGSTLVGVQLPGNAVLHVQAAFKDGSTASTQVTTADSAVGKEAWGKHQQQLVQNDADARTRLEGECSGGQGDSCLKLAYSYGLSPSGMPDSTRQQNQAMSIEYFRKACAFKVESACTHVDAIEHPIVDQPTGPRQQQEAHRPKGRTRFECAQICKNDMYRCLGTCTNGPFAPGCGGPSKVNSCKETVESCWQDCTQLPQ